MGSPEEIQDNPATEFVRNFIGEDRLSNISPDSPIEILVQEPVIRALPETKASDLLERMEDEGCETAQVVDRKGIWRGMALCGC